VTQLELGKYEEDQIDAAKWLVIIL
jgi:hypothetical protein